MKSQALGQLPGQRLFSISTVKAQLNKTAAFLGLQDTGWPWTMALTVLDVYVHLLGFVILVCDAGSFFSTCQSGFLKYSYDISVCDFPEGKRMNSCMLASTYTECLKLVEVQI